MKVLGFGLSVFIVFVSIAAGSFSAQDNADSSETKIIALEKAWNQAYKYRDGKALGAILHNSVILVSDDGSLQPRGVFLASVDAARSSDGQQAEPESISVQVFGDVAIATGIFRKKGIENGKLYVRRIRFVDTWVNWKGSWECIAASATPILH